MADLILRHLEGFSEHQFEAVHEGRHVGRIYLANPYDKHGVNWYWGVAFFERPRDRAHLPGWDGYAPSREAAMEAFRKAWDGRG